MTKIFSEIQNLPKAEIHVHIEGTLKPDQAKEIAARNGVTLDDALFNDDGTYHYDDFLDLVTKVYQGVADAMQTKQDYEDVVYSYLKQSAAENVIYTELIACPGQCERTGVSYKDMIDGIAAGIDRARDDFGIEARINVTFERHRSGKPAEEDADRILSYQHEYIVGLDIAGGEQPDDFEPFQDIFDRVIDGFQRPLGIRMHAGEGVGPENVKKALEFNPTRIGHGVRSIEDFSVIQELIARDVTLEICPTSNIYLMPQYGGDFKKHPAKQLYDAGVKITLSSDDPGMFPNCSISGEYQVAYDEMGFDVLDMMAMTQNSIEASYAPESLKQVLLEKMHKMGAEILAKDERRQQGI